MIGLGTIINMAAIILGGLIGMAGRRFINAGIQDTLMKANGLCVIFIGASGALQKIFYIDKGNLNTQGTMVLIISFAVGSLIGEIFNLESRIEQFGIWLREQSGNSEDSNFLNGFLTASFTVCIGAMAIVGALQDGMTGSILIFCVGINLIKKDVFKVSNMLPVILVAAVLGIFGL